MGQGEDVRSDPGGVDYHRPERIADNFAGKIGLSGPSSPGGPGGRGGVVPCGPGSSVPGGVFGVSGGPGGSPGDGPSTPGGVPGGVPGGIPGGSPGGVQRGYINQSIRVSFRHLDCLEAPRVGQHVPDLSAAGAGEQSQLAITDKGWLTTYVVHTHRPTV